MSYVNIDDIFDYTSFQIDREPHIVVDPAACSACDPPGVHHDLPGPLLHVVGGGPQDHLRLRRVPGVRHLLRRLRRALRALALPPGRFRGELPDDLT